jgi:phenylacetate-CoA ligase
MFSKKCRCGRATPRLGPIVGRKNQKLKFKGTSLFPSTLQTVLEATRGVESFVVIARADNELCDSIEILFHGSASAANLREVIQARTKITPLIRRTAPSRIEALQMPPAARKRRTFVDLR